MKTKKRFKTVELMYWTCPIKEHNHLTKEVAQRCIDKHKNFTPKMPTDARRLRQEIIGNCWLSGMKIKDIAAIVGMSQSVIRGKIHMLQGSARLPIYYNPPLNDGTWPWMTPEKAQKIIEFKEW
jgi:hypothetical protein